MRILDLFCGAGGAAMGYHRAGFDVVGVDIAPQPHYPFEVHQADALYFLEARWHEFDAIHASPPCQLHSELNRHDGAYPEYIAPTRELLRQTGMPYVIENVMGAPLIAPVKICGASVPGLRVIRHRLFESNYPISGIACPKPHPKVFTYDRRKKHFGKLNQNRSYVQVTGGGNCSVANKLDAMGIDWMTAAEVNEAVPPAYTQHIGADLLHCLSPGR